MKLSITLNGTDVTSLVSLKSLQIKRELSGNVGTCSFTVQLSADDYPRYDGAVYDSAKYFDEATFGNLNQAPVEITNTDTLAKVFSGSVAKVKKVSKATNFQEWTLSCQDHTVNLLKAKVTKTYTNQSDKAIIQDFFTNFVPGSIDATDTDILVANIEKYEAKDKTVKAILDDILKLSGGEYWIDPDKAFHYKATSLSTAPFNLSSSPDFVTTFPFRNTGASYELDTVPGTFANKITVIGAFQVSTQTNIQATAEDATSIAQFGTFEHQIFNDQITSTTDAQTMADAILLEMKDPVERGSVVVDKDGLEVGNLIDIRSDAWDIESTYVIRSLSIKQETKSRTRYDIQFGEFRANLTDKVREILDRVSSNNTIPQQANIPDNSIVSQMIIDGAITELKLANLAVTNAKLALASVTEDILAAAAVTNTKIADNSISTPKLQAASVTAGILAAGSVLTDKLAANSVVAGKVAADTITGNEILAGSITSLDAVFANGAILNADIGDAAITSAKIGTAQVQTINVANAAITNAKIANLAVGSAQIQDLAVTNAKIASLAVDDAKISSLAANKITAGTISASVTLTSPTLDIDNASLRLDINATDGFLHEDTGNATKVQINAGVIKAFETSTPTTFTQVSPSGVTMRISNNVIASLGGATVGGNNWGSITLSNNGGQRASLTADTNIGRLKLRNSSNTEEIVLEAVGGDATADSFVIKNSSGSTRINMGVTEAGATGQITVSSNVGGENVILNGDSTDSNRGLFVDNQRVVGPRQTDPGLNPTTEQLRQVLLNHGLI